MRGARWLRLGGRASLLACVAIVVVGAAAALAASVIDSGGSDPALQHASPVASISPVLSANLAAFRRASRADDPLPATLQNAMNHFVPQFGAQGALARHVAVRHGADIYLVPAQGGVCFVQSDDSELFCAPQSAVHDGTALALDLCSPTLPSGEVEVAGILPDGAAEVAAHMTDDTRQTLDASGGVYSARFARTGSLPSAIEWNGPDGHHSVRTNIPPDASTMTCVNPREMPPPSQLPVPPNARTAPTVAPR